jgi:O-antigen ligase
MKNFSISLIKYSLFLLAVFIPFSTSGIGISVSLLTVGVLIFYLSGGNFIYIPDKETKKIFYFMLGIILIMILSTLFSYDLVSSIKRTITVLGYFFIFASVFEMDDKEYLKKVIYVLIFLCVLHSIYAIFQYFTGLDIVKKGYEKYDRVIGIVGHFNSLAGILGVIFPVLFCLFYFLKNKKVILGISSILMLFAIVLTFTRGIWLGIIGAMFIIGLLADRRIFLILIVFILILLIIPSTKKRIKETFNERNGTTRIMFLKETPKLILKRPILGFGPDSFKKVFYEKNPNFPEKGHFHPHNMYLHIMFELGVVGLILFLYLFYEMIKNLLMIYNSTTENFVKFLSLGALGSIIVFLIYGLVDEPFRAHFAPYGLFFLLSISYRLGLLEQK